MKWATEAETYEFLSHKSEREGDNRPKEHPCVWVGVSHQCCTSLFIKLPSSVTPFSRYPFTLISFNYKREKKKKNNCRIETFSISPVLLTILEFLVYLCYEILGSGAAY